MATKIITRTRDDGSQESHKEYHRSKVIAKIINYKFMLKVIAFSMAFSSCVYALDYKSRSGPKNSTECRDYASSITRAVGSLLESGLSDDDIEKRFEANLAKVPELAASTELPDGLKEDEFIEFMTGTLEDIRIWYRDQKIIRSEQTMYSTIVMECGMAVIDKDFENDMREFERQFGE